jgi:hypothetical protein
MDRKNLQSRSQMRTKRRTNHLSKGISPEKFMLSAKYESSPLLYRTEYDSKLKGLRFEVHKAVSGHTLGPQALRSSRWELRVLGRISLAHDCHRANIEFSEMRSCLCEG